MVKLAESTNASATQEPSSLWHKALKIASVPIAALSGLLVAAFEVHNGAFQKAKSVDGNPLFRSVRDKYVPQSAENAEKLVAGTITTAQFQAKELEIKMGHSREIGARMEMAGLGNKWMGVKDLPAKWRYVNRVTKGSAIIQAMTVTGIVIGAMLTVANSKTLLDLLASKDKTEDKSPTP